MSTAPFLNSLKLRSCRSDYQSSDGAGMENEVAFLGIFESIAAIE
jgi:hypothetical protein